jgi:hypothetical protein
MRVVLMKWLSVCASNVGLRRFEYRDAARLVEAVGSLDGSFESVDVFTLVDGVVDVAMVFCGVSSCSGCGTAGDVAEVSAGFPVAGAPSGMCASSIGCWLPEDVFA